MYLLTYFLLCSSLYADVPKIILDSERSEKAIALESPIHSVTLYSDRSLIERKAEKRLPAGMYIVKFSDISGNIYKDSIRIDVEGGQVYRLEKELVEKSDFDLEELQTMIVKTENLQDKKKSLLEQKKRYSSEITNIKKLQPSQFPAAKHRTSPVSYDVKNWITYTSFLSSHVASRQKKLRSIDDDIRSLEEELQELTIQSQPLLQSNSKQKYEIIVVVKVPKESTLTFDLSYYTPTSSWIPNYNIYYDSTVDSVRIEQSAIFQQNSGENWNDVSITLSTAIPNQKLYIPQLNTWTLGEQEEYVPQAYATNSYRSTLTKFGEPQKSLTQNQSKQQAEIEMYRGQVKHLHQLLSQYQQRVISFEGLEVEGKMIKIGPEEPIQVRRSASFNTLIDDSGSEHMGVVGYGTRGRTDSISNGHSRSLVPRMRSAPMDPAVDSSIAYTQSYGIEASNYYQKPTYSSQDLPIAQCSGIAYIYEVTGKFDIPSNGQPLQIPVDSFSMLSTPFYESTPSIEEMAYLKATLQHKGELPILRGQSNIFLNGKFNSTGILNTTLQDGLLDVPLGADENIRIKRNITPKQRKEGFLIGTQVITDYEIQIDIGNYKNKDIKIRVIDQIPKTNNSKISIGDISSSHRFKQKPDANGILFWEIEIPAQETTQIILNYSITRPKDWVLWGD